MRLAQRWLTALAGLMLLAGTAQAQVVVASKIDTEGGILGNIIRLVLEADGIPVTNRIELGGTPVVRTAIVAGTIDIYPEYTGNAAFFFGVADEPGWNDPATAYAQARTLDYDANRIVWLQPAPANNTWAIAVRRELAEANDLRTLSDFAAFVLAGGDVKLAASAEFVNSPAALPAFQGGYGFFLKASQLITLQGGDTIATIAAASDGTAGANAAMVYRTDGAIASAGLRLLEDDKGVQPVYQPAPIVREVMLQRYPRIAELLAPVFARLDLTTLQLLNARVQAMGESAASVAEAFLKANDFVR